MPTRKRTQRVNSTKVPDLLSASKHPDAAGIDLAATEAVVALPPGRAPEAVRTFSLYTKGLYELRDWLKSSGIRTVAVESTGNYWVCLYEVLEDAGIMVWLVNARHVKMVPGRKTDVCDAQWLQQLHSCGLLKKAFRPEQAIAGLRHVMRHRASLVQRATAALQTVQKTLVECNLRLHHVLSDLDGVSGQRMVEAILAGERDPHQLAGLRDQRCRTPLAEVIEALQGHYRPAYLFVLGQAWAYWKQTREALKECDQKLEELLQNCTTEADARELKVATVARSHKNSFGFDLQQEALRFYEVDLCTIPAVSSSTLAVLMSEVGPRADLLKHFANAQAFSSWLCLCPENRITGGKVFAAKTRPTSNRLSTALRMAAMALGHSKTELGNFCRRMKARLGKAEGITAAAHKLARIIYTMIVTRQSYDESKAFALSPRKQARQLANLRRQATRLGFALVPTTC